MLEIAGGAVAALMLVVSVFMLGTMYGERQYRRRVRMGISDLTLLGAVSDLDHAMVNKNAFMDAAREIATHATAEVRRIEEDWS